MSIWNLIAADIFAANHAYSRPYSVFSGGQWGRAEGEPRCVGKVESQGFAFLRYHQCEKPGKHRLANGTTWCGVHAPAAVARRHAQRADRDRKWQEDFARRMKANQDEQTRRAAYPQLLDALRQIAEGHNDPRALAREVLDRFNP